MLRIKYIKLLRGWFIVRGKHDTPISGRFDSREEAINSWLWKNNRKARVHG